MNKRRVLVTLPLMFFLITSLVSGCSKPGQQAAQQKTEEKVIKIGASSSLTGGFSKEGVLLKNGYLLWEEQVNSKGGINVGNEKYKVKMIIYDNKSDPETAAKLTEKLITEDKVNFLLSPTISSLVFPTTSIAEKYKVVQVAAFGNAHNIWQRGYKYTFGVLPKAASNLVTPVKMIRDYGLDVKSIAIIYPDDIFPTFGAEGARAEAEKLGISVVMFDKYPKGLTDFSPIISKIKSLNPDAIMSAAYFEEATGFAKQLKEQGVNPKMLIFQDAPGMPDFVPVLGQAAEGIIGTAWWAPNLNYKDSLFGSTQDFANLYKSKYGEEPAYHSAAAAAAGEVLMLAIEKAGTLDTEAVRKALLELDVETFYMPVKFGTDYYKNDPPLEQINIKGSNVVLQIQNGKKVYVYPVEAKQPDAKVIYPKPAW